MKNLLYKELKLCLNPQLIIFACLSILIMVPEWPAGIGFIYTLAGLSTIFPRALADKDVMYTAMLPVRKGDVVKSKTLLICFVELAAVLISIPAAIIKALLIDPGLVTAAAQNSNSGMDASYILAVSPNMVAYGSVFMAFGIYALVLVPWYFKNPVKVNWPQLASILIAAVALSIGMGLQALIPVLHEQGGLTSLSFWIQFAYLVVGLGVYVGCTFGAERLGEKRFASVDL